MRNLKRALSMAMASVMLMGMSVVGTSAVSVNDFSDVDAINNQEAVAIATGLGIFDGYDDGSFKPEKVVTRAEMAVVIAKILHGADVNPANFAGAGKFTDVPAWAEGYVNLVAALGIIEGYGDGKFGPNDPVTTVQASTMLMKALGYYTSEGDALGADWALTVTSKANALGIYGDKALSMNEGLTREDVAELTFNALFAQRVAFDDVRGLHVKSNDRNVVVTNGTKDETNTLAQNTFGLYAVEGVVVANGMTDESLAASVKSEEMTTLKFTEATDLNKDGKYEYAVGNMEDFEVETGLDMIGHAAKIYYKIEKKAPVVYAVVDQATLVAEIDNNGNTTKLAKAANDAGFKKNSILDIKARNYIVNYDMDTTLATYFDDQGTATTPLTPDGNTNDIKWIDGSYSYDAVNTNAAEGTETINAAKKLILISNSANKEVDTVIVLDQYLDTVEKIDKDGEYTLTNERAGVKMLVVDGEAQEEDYVIVTDIGNKGEVLVANTAEVVNANVTKIIAKSTTTSTTTGVVADGETYSKSKVLPNNGVAALDNTTAFDAVNKIGNYGLVLDAEGKMIAMVTEPAAPSYAYVAQYGYYNGKTANSVSTKDVLTALVYFADGTSGVYDVDLGASEKGTFWNDADTDNKYDAGEEIAPATAYTTLNGGAGKEGELFAGSKGIWNVKVQSNGTVKILGAAAYGDEALTTTTHDTFANNAQLVKGHSTMLLGTDATKNVEYENGATYTKDALYSNNDTIFFYVNGTYNASASDNGLTVNVVTGIKNVKGFKNDTTAKTGVKNAWVNMDNFDATNDKGRITYEVMGIEGVVYGGATGIYYYDTNKFEVDYVDGKGYTATYTLYGADGETYTVTYDNQGKYFTTSTDAWNHGAANPDGFYKIGANNLVNYVNEEVVNNTTGPVKSKAGDTDKTKNIYGTLEDVTYVVNAVALYDEYTDNLYDDTTVIGSIAENAKFVDMTGHGLNSLDAIVDAIEDKDTVYISYRYDAKTLEASIVYVSDYAPATTSAPGATVTGGLNITTVAKNADGKNIDVTVGTAPAKATKVLVELQVYSVDNMTWTTVHSETLTFTTATTLNTTNMPTTTGVGQMFQVVVNGVVYPY